LSWARTGTNTAMVLLAVVAVLMTVVGPVFDHHFAERQASHGHVFLDQVTPEHGHSADDGHGHDAAEPVSVSIVATSDSDATGMSVDNVVPPTATKPGHDLNALRFVGLITDEDPPTGQTGLPLARPPIA
jgi:hypothetical protein